MKLQVAAENNMILTLLKYIEENGIERIRTVGEQINSLVYHMVLY